MTSSYPNPQVYNGKGTVVKLRMRGSKSCMRSPVRRRSTSDRHSLPQQHDRRLEHDVHCEVCDRFEELFRTVHTHHSSSCHKKDDPNVVSFSHLHWNLPPDARPPSLRRCENTPSEKPSGSEPMFV
ncbi:hypothetical protein AAVH_39206 [Aphelenchoides avenae]|nr:hypothetical protein AAVH_39206 [Aphelenchus avenae]